MPVIPRQSKATTDTYNWYFDYSGWPQLDDDTLVSAVVTADVSGLTLGSPTVVAATKRVYVSIDDGADGVRYLLRCVATTSGGQNLTGFLALTVTDADLDVVVYPSQLSPYIDTRVLMQLLYDDGEIAEGADAPSINTIDGNARALALAQKAWGRLTGAAMRGDVYTYNQLRDLAYDPIRGQELLSLVADLFYCQLIKRRRYVKGEPQNEDPTCAMAEEALEQLKKGDRIFVLEGVAILDDNGQPTGATYTNVMGPPTTLRTGTLGQSRCSRPEDRFWGCTDPCRRRPGQRGGCGGH